MYSIQSCKIQYSSKLSITHNFIFGTKFFKNLEVEFEQAILKFEKLNKNSYKLNKKLCQSLII